MRRPLGAAVPALPNPPPPRRRTMRWLAWSALIARGSSRSLGGGEAGAWRLAAKRLRASGAAAAPQVPPGEMRLDRATHALGDLAPAFGRADIGGVGLVGEITAFE